MREIYEIVKMVAKSDTTTVLIQGESGTGKEMIADLIHRYSPRHSKPFLEINCASLPEELLEKAIAKGYFGFEMIWDKMAPFFRKMMQEAYKTTETVSKIEEDNIRKFAGEITKA